MKNRRIYLAQYDCTWSLSREAWQRFLANGVAGKSYDLDEYGRRIKRAPAWADVVRPLDWTVDDFKAESER